MEELNQLKLNRELIFPNFSGKRIFKRALEPENKSQESKLRSEIIRFVILALFNFVIT